MKKLILIYLLFVTNLSLAQVISTDDWNLFASTSLTLSSEKQMFIAGDTVHLAYSFMEVNGMQMMLGFSQDYTIDLPSIPANSGVASNQTLAGTTGNDICQCSHPYNSAINIMCVVTAPGSIQIRVFNNSGSAVDLPSEVFKVRIIR